MQRSVRTLISIFFLLANGYSNASTSDYYHDSRTQFLKAEELLKQGKSTAYNKLRAQLKDYPLTPYLDHKQLSQEFSQIDSSAISGFISQYPDLPIANRLNRSWLNYLAKKKRWQEYREHFDLHPVHHVHYECQQQSALLKGTPKQKKAALYHAKTLWLVPHSQPKVCDPLFKAWMDTGRPTSGEAYSRFWLSLGEGNIKLARYLTKKLQSTKHKQDAEIFWKIYNAPKLVVTNSLQLLPKKHQVITAKIAFKRWFRQHPITATNAWIKHRKRVMPETPRDDVTQYIGIRLNSRYHTDAISLSHKLDPDFKLTELTEVRVRNALAQQNWSAVKLGIQHLPEPKQSEDKWIYWSIIADRHLTPKIDQEERLNHLAQDRSYYGFLAAELNSTPFKLNAVSGDHHQSQIAKLSKRPAVARAGELFRLGRLIEANREWNLALSTMDDQEKQVAGYVAKSWGWHLQAIINAAKTERWDHVDLRFPHPHANLFKKQAIHHGLDLSFPVAIARQESAFLFNAQSRVGARGLMQLMPKTAKQTARKHKIPYTRTAQLFNPGTNIKLGSAYIADMLKKFDNNPAYAAAAYNAGPHRVSKWLKQRGELPLDIWIETIPFKETRRYVQNVLAFRVIYDRLEGRQASLLTEKQVQLLALNQSSKTAL